MNITELIGCSLVEAQELFKNTQYTMKVSYTRGPKDKSVLTEPYVAKVKKTGDREILLTLVEYRPPLI